MGHDSRSRGCLNSEAAGFLAACLTESALQIVGDPLVLRVFEHGLRRTEFGEIPVPLSDPAGFGLNAEHGFRIEDSTITYHKMDLEL